MCKDCGPQRHNENERGRCRIAATTTDVRVKGRAAASVRGYRTSFRQSRDLQKALTASLQSERRHVVREYHLIQHLAYLAWIRHRVLDLIYEIRRIAHQLNPSLLDHRGLSGAVRSSVREYQHREKIPLRLVLKGVPATIPLPITSSS